VQATHYMTCMCCTALGALLLQRWLQAEMSCSARVRPLSPASCSPLPSLLPAENKVFQAIIDASRFRTAGHVELRIHEELSRRQPDQPIQFGLFARTSFDVGEEVTPYGGILRHENDFRASGDLKSHARKLQEGFVLDGLPLANMLHRPIPSQVIGGLDALLRKGMLPLLPSLSRYAAADLQ
jgi:hypothetical protein